MALRLYPNNRISDYSYHHISEKLYYSMADLICNNQGWTFVFHFIDRNSSHSSSAWSMLFLITCIDMI